MSYSFGPIYRTVSWSLEQHGTALGQLQLQVSTGSKLNATSDDPSDAHRVMALQADQQSMGNYIEKMDNIIGKLDMSSAALDEISEQMTNFRKDAMQAQNLPLDQREIIANGIEDLLQTLMSLANSDRVGQHFFGGSDAATTPYVAEYKDGEISRVIYQGSTEGRKAEVAPGVEIPAVFVGDEMFRLDNRQGIVFGTSNTGAAAGTATSSIRGEVTLDVEEILPASVPPKYKLSINGGDTWTPEIEVPPGDANTVVTDSKTGEVLYVDTTAITGPGSDKVRAPGTDDIFSSLITIRDLLRAPDEMGDQLAEAIESFADVHGKVVAGVTVVGTRTVTLTTIRDGFENVNFNSAQEVARLEEADIAQVAIDLTQRQTLYEMSLGIAGRLLSTNLLDFIR